MPRQSAVTKMARQQQASTGLAPREIISARATAIDNMNDALAALFKEVESTFDDMRVQNLRFYHKLGKVVLRIRQQPAIYQGRDGTAGMTLLERAAGTKARTLNKSATFADLYTDDAFEVLIKMVNKGANFQLHWGHVSFLLTVPSQQMRTELAANALSGLWDPERLHEEIKKRMGRTGGHGRSHKVPETIDECLRQMAKATKTWLEKSEKVWNGDTESVFAKITDAHISELTPEMLPQLQTLRNEIQALREYADRHTDSIDKTYEYVQEMLSNAEKLAADRAELDKQKQTSKRGRAAAR